MKTTSFFCFLLFVAVPGMARADVLELKDGTVLNGRYSGGTAGTVRFETSAGLEPIPLVTSGHKEAGQASIAKAAKGAGAGAAIGAIAGDAGKGAAIGATAGALARGQTITVPTGTLLEFTLMQSATIPVGQ